MAAGNRVTYQRGDVTEWYTNGPLGLEQGFTLAKPQADGASVSLRLSGSLTPHLSGQEIDFTAAGGRSVLRYSGLHAFDSTGRALPARLELDGRTLLLRVDDRGARYPVTVDPLVQVGSKLTPTSPSGSGGFGWSVALSDDGRTALVGAPHENSDVGAAWIFTRTGAGSASAWTQEATLVPGVDEEIGAGLFGSSVALSADGGTALIGGPADNTNAGAAWVFAFNSLTWSQQGSKLTGGGEIGPGKFGYSVALSGDGLTAAIGGPADDANNNGGTAGTAWVFLGTDGWFQIATLHPAQGRSTVHRHQRCPQQRRQQGADRRSARQQRCRRGLGVLKTTSAAGPKSRAALPRTGHRAGLFGASVALSNDGLTALIGGPGDRQRRGRGLGVH